MAILLAALMYLALPTVGFIVGYLAGLPLKILFGGLIVETVSTLFATSTFTAEMIPPITGILSAISFYITSPYNND